MDKLADKRVGIIGTGATSVQCVPHLARACKELYVFQRTPSSVDVRANAPIDPDWFSGIATPGWQQRWLENFTANQAGGDAEEDLVQDGWTDLSRRIRAKIMQLPREQRTLPNMRAAFEDSDFEKMEEIRTRVDAHRRGSRDGRQAQGLVSPALQAAVLPRRISAGVQHARARIWSTPTARASSGSPKTASSSPARNIELDCIIYASGFEVGTEYKRRSGFDLTGRDGVKLSEYWAEGMRTKHGIHVHGFPNAFFVQPTQGANLISNVPHNLTEAARTIAMMVEARAGQRLQGNRSHQGSRGRLGRAAADRPSAG